MLRNKVAVKSSVFWFVSLKFFFRLYSIGLFVLGKKKFAVLLYSSRKLFYLHLVPDLVQKEQLPRASFPLWHIRISLCSYFTLW